MNNRACYTVCLHNANNACAYGSVNDIATCPCRQAGAKVALVDLVSGLLQRFKPKETLPEGVILCCQDRWDNYPHGEIAAAARALGLPLAGEPGGLAEGEEAITSERLARHGIKDSNYDLQLRDYWNFEGSKVKVLRPWRHGWIVRRIPAQAKPVPSGVCHNHGCASQHDDKCYDDGSHFDPAHCTSRVTAKPAPESADDVRKKNVDYWQGYADGKTGILPCDKPAPESVEARLTPGELAEIQTLADKLAEDYCKAISPLVYKVINDTLAAKDTEITRLRGVCEAAKNLYDSVHWIAEGMDSTTAGTLWRNLRDTLHAAGIYVISDRVSQADKP